MKNIIKFLSYIVMIFIILFAVVTPVHAVSIEDNQLKNELSYIFSSKISLKGEMNGESETKEIDFSKYKVSFDGNVMKVIPIVPVLPQYNIEYNLQSKTCKFSLVEDIKLKEDAGMEETLVAVDKIAQQFDILSMCYLAVSNLVNVDPSLAYTFYKQNESLETSNDIYSLVLDETDTDTVCTIKSNLEINFEELSKLKSSQVKREPKFTVTLPKRTSTNNQTTTKVEENKSPVNTQSNLSTQKEVRPRLPNTGISFMCILLSIVVVSTFAYFIYKKIKKMDF